MIYVGIFLIAAGSFTFGTRFEHREEAPVAAGVMFVCGVIIVALRLLGAA
jgi:hypothetical protein